MLGDAIASKKLLRLHFFLMNPFKPFLNDVKLPQLFYKYFVVQICWEFVHLFAKNMNGRPHKLEIWCVEQSGPAIGIGNSAQTNKCNGVGKEEANQVSIFNHCHETNLILVHKVFCHLKSAISSS